MRITQMIALASCLGMLAVPGIVNAHCGMCGKGEAKSEGKAGMGQDHMAMMTKELNLTEDQKTKIKAIKDDKHQKMEALRNDAHTKIKAVLNKDQQAKFDKLMADKSQGHCEACAKGVDHKH